MQIKTHRKKSSDNSHSLRLFDIAEFSVHDGPGRRTVVYFQGCNVNCDWCHSPHSQPHNAPLMYNSNMCKGCQRCVQACKMQSHKFVQDKHVIDRYDCNQCSSCIEACPNSINGVKGSALHLPTVEISALSPFEQIKPYIQLCGKQGGITLSGGEALLQTNAAIDLMRYCKDKGFHIAVETSGLLPDSIYKKAIPFVDLWLYGMRVITGKKHNRNDKQIDQNLELLVSNNANILPRIPMVPGFFDQDDILDSITKLLIKYSIRTVCLNPWNIHYDVNYTQCDIPLQMAKPSDEKIKACENKIISVFANLNFNIYENDGIKKSNEHESQKTL